MSRRGNSWDNPLTESFVSLLKKERIRKRIDKARDMTRADIFDYFEISVKSVAIHLIKQSTRGELDFDEMLLDER